MIPVGRGPDHAGSSRRQASRTAAQYTHCRARTGAAGHTHALVTPVRHRTAARPPAAAARHRRGPTLITHRPMSTIRCPVAWWGFRVPLAMLNTCGTHCAPGASVPSSMVAAAVLDGGVVTHAAPHPGGPQNRAALGGQHPLAVGCMLGPPNITIQRDRVSNSTTARASIVWARLAAALPPPVS